MQKNNLEFVKSLIGLKADLNSQDERGHTILTKAIKSNNNELLEILKQNESQIDFSIGKIFNFQLIQKTNLIFIILSVLI